MMLLSPVAMHIPDGFLSTPVAILLWLVSAAWIGYALKRVGNVLNERQVPLMGVLAAAIFAGQMLNFAVAGGTSGHLMGAALAVILLGPWPAMLVMTTVVTVQALIFQDGGLLALGANLFNMAIVGVAVSYMAYRTVVRLAGNRSRGILAAGFLAAWFSVEFSALAVALQLALSGTSPASLAIPAMAGVHALIGLGEGLITLGALAFLTSVRPDLLRAGAKPQAGSRLAWLSGLLFALALAVASPLASTRPDGLEWFAGQGGFLQRTKAPLYRLLPEYTFPGLANVHLATILAGVLGTLLVCGAALIIAYTRRSRPAHES
jgi:cobalt/nickel transport system permease protein